MKVLTKEEAADLVFYFYHRAWDVTRQADLTGRLVREMVRLYIWAPGEPENTYHSEDD